MKMIVLFIFVTALSLPAVAGSAETVAASDRELAHEDRIAELERTVAVLVEELERARGETAVPEATPREGGFGLGSAAAKHHRPTRGVSLGGYGEAFYRKIVGDGSKAKRDSADLLRLVLYAGYEFSEKILFNSELEFEHATSGSTATSSGGSVSVEFAHLDFRWRDWANFRTGLLLVPMGFVNRIHEPPFFLGVNRPEVERQIIPTTWREVGAGLFGSVGERVDYAAYAIGGFNAAGFRPGGLRGGRQKGNRGLAEHLAFVGGLGWSPLPQLRLGGSVYLGRSGQNQILAAADGSEVRVPDSLTTVWEVHAQLREGGLHLRGLFAMVRIGAAGDLTRALRAARKGTSTILGPTEAIGGEMLGAYGEISYDLLQWLSPGGESSLEPFYRFEYYDTQRGMPEGFAADGNQERRIHTVGLQFKPIPNVVLKLDWRNRSAAEGGVEDEVNLGVGLAF